MKPILLNTKVAQQYQVIISGRPHVDCTAGDYYNYSEDIMIVVEGEDSRLAGNYDIIIMQTL